MSHSGTLQIVNSMPDDASPVIVASASAGTAMPEDASPVIVVSASAGTGVQ